MKAFAIATLFLFAVIPIDTNRPQIVTQYNVESKIIWYVEDGNLVLQTYIQNNSKRQVSSYKLVIAVEDWDGNITEHEFTGPRENKKLNPSEAENWEEKINVSENNASDAWIKEFKIERSRMHIYKSSYFILILLLMVGIAAGVT